MSDFSVVVGGGGGGDWRGHLKRTHLCLLMMIMVEHAHERSSQQKTEDSRDMTYESNTINY